MAQIFFKKRHRKASGWASLGLVILLFAGVAFTVAGPLFQIDGLRSFFDPAATFGFRLRIIMVGLGLVALGGLFTLVGILHTLTSPRVRLSWRGAVALLMIAGLGWSMGQTYRRIHEAIPRADLTTSPENPPAFLHVQVPAAVASDTVHASTTTRFLPVVSPLTPRDLSAKALRVAGRLKWRIISSNTSRGRFEAFVQDRWFGVRAVIVVRVVARGSGSVLDIRAVSDTDGGRWGLNVAAVREFLDKMAA